MIDYFGADLELKRVDEGARLIIGTAAGHSNIDRVKDIIDPSASAKATARLSGPADVAVLVGHNSAMLPIGIPQKIEATPRGLYTETYILKGPAGDNLLAVARDLLDHGQALGMSIGYKTHDSRREIAAGKTIRRIMDYELREYSFASQQAIANPQALVSAVKSRRKAATQRKAGTMQYRVEQQAGGERWSVLADTDADGDADDNLLIGTYPTADIANAVADALRRYDQDDAADGANDGTPGNGANDDEAQQGAADKTATTAHASTSTGSTVHVNDLPNSSFLYVEDGDDDQEGRRVPRTKRHLPYRDAEGKLDRPNLETALAHLGPDATGVGTLPGLDSSTKAQLAARARRLLEQDQDGKAYAPAEEWKGGAPLSIYGLGIRLLDLAEQLCDEHKAMALLAEETKDGQRIRAPMRDHLGAVGKDLADLLRWAETIERGEDGRQRLAWFKQQLALTEV